MSLEQCERCGELHGLGKDPAYCIGLLRGLLAAQRENVDVGERAILKLEERVGELKELLRTAVRWWEHNTSPLRKVGPDEQTDYERCKAALGETG